MNGRGFHGDYRFGYQGSEKDNEVSGDGNSYTTEFRQLDPRLGRWFSVDPVFQPWQSPYTSMDNDPVNLTDVLGDDAVKDGDKGKSLGENHEDKTPNGNGAENFNPHGDKPRLDGGKEKRNITIPSEIKENATKAKKWWSWNKVKNWFKKEQKNSVDLGITPEKGETVFGTLKKNYPKKKIKHKVTENKVVNEDKFKNHCAINLSETLSKSGFSLKGRSGTRCWGDVDDKKCGQHIIRATDMINAIKEKADNAVELTGENFNEYVKGKKGIIYFEDYYDDSGGTSYTGDHIDLWDGNKLVSYRWWGTLSRNRSSRWGESWRGSPLKQAKKVIFIEIKDTYDE